MKTKTNLMFFTIILMLANTKGILANFESSNPYAVSLTESNLDNSKPLTKPDTDQKNKQRSKIQQLKEMQTPKVEAGGSYISRAKKMLPTGATLQKAAFGLLVSAQGASADECFNEYLRGRAQAETDTIKAYVKAGHLGFRNIGIAYVSTVALVAAICVTVAVYRKLNKKNNATEEAGIN